MVGVAILKFSNKSAWELALKLLGGAGISTVCEGGLGWLEICVNPDQVEKAKGLLNNEPALLGKIFSLDQLK